MSTGQMAGKINPYRNWLVAALIVTIAFAPIATLIFVPSPIPDRIRAYLFLFLSFPGVLLLLPLLGNIHNMSMGFILSATALNWFIYTSFLRWFIARRRHKKVAPLGP